MDVSVTSMSQARELFSAIQDPVAFAVFFPFLMMFLYGMGTGEFQEENFWIMIFVYVVSGLLVLLFFPNALMILG